MANIYSADHYDMIVNYIRQTILPFWNMEYIYLWTGMEYKNNQVYLDSGETISLPAEIWYPSFPQDTALSSHIVIRIVSDSDSIRQGLMNYEASQPWYGALCVMP
ncbi:uncharacterized protein LOC144425838 [Styela clava]